jgi:hypothetical protein
MNSLPNEKAAPHFIFSQKEQKNSLQHLPLKRPGEAVKLNAHISHEKEMSKKKSGAAKRARSF